MRRSRNAEEQKCGGAEVQGRGGEVARNFGTPAPQPLSSSAPLPSTLDSLILGLLWAAR